MLVKSVLVEELEDVAEDDSNSESLDISDSRLLNECSLKTSRGCGEDADRTGLEYQF